MLENEADSANSQQELPPKPPGRKMSDNTSSGDGGEGDSRFVGPGVPRLPHPGNGTFPVGNLPLSAVGEAGVFGGQMISPTHPSRTCSIHATSGKRFRCLFCVG